MVFGHAPCARSPGGTAHPSKGLGAARGRFCPSFSGGAPRDSSCACALCQWAQGYHLRPRPRALVRLRGRSPALSRCSAESVSPSESVLGAGEARRLWRASCRIISSPLPVSRPTSLFIPLPPLLAQPWQSRRQPLSPRPSPRRPPGPSPLRSVVAAGAREPAPPWGRRAAAPPVRVRRAEGPRPREGGPRGSGKAHHPRVLEASSPGKERLENGLRGRGVTGLAGGEEITG